MTSTSSPTFHALKTYGISLSNDTWHLIIAKGQKYLFNFKTVTNSLDHPVPMSLSTSFTKLHMMLIQDPQCFYFRIFNSTLIVQSCPTSRQKDIKLTPSFSICRYRNQLHLSEVINNKTDLISTGMFLPFFPFFVVLRIDG